MTALLDDLIERLTEDVPAREDVPSEAQYERMVKEAVRDFGRRAGRVKRDTINVIAGTATYDLPGDFLRMITLFGLVANHEGIINSPEGLIPVSNFFREKYTVSGMQITFYPIPRYTLTRSFSYKTGWVLTDDDYAAYYDEMGDEEADIILLKAKSLALELLANQTAGDGWKYQIGDEMVDKSGQQAAYKVRLEAAEDRYSKAVENYNGNTGMMG